MEQRWPVSLGIRHAAYLVASFFFSSKRGPRDSIAPLSNVVSVALVSIARSLQQTGSDTGRAWMIRCSQREC